MQTNPLWISDSVPFQNKFPLELGLITTLADVEGIKVSNVSEALRRIKVIRSMENLIFTLEQSVYCIYAV